MIPEIFSKKKWYVNLLLGGMFIYFLVHLLESGFILLHPSVNSPLIPDYATYFVAIRVIVILMRSIVGIFGIIFLYQNKKLGWIFSLSAAFAFMSLLGYEMIHEMTFIFLYIEIPYLLIIVYLLWKDTQQTFDIKPLNYVFPVLFSIILVMLESGAFPLSMKIGALIK